MYAAFIDCIFTDNYCSEYGGAIHNTSVSMATCINCLFVGNTAVLAGGALYDNGYDLGSHLVNCTLAGNNCTAVHIAEYGSATLSNCILWDNLCGTGTGQSAQILYQEGTWRTGYKPSVNYCCIQGWDGSFGGVGNFSGDPLFVSSGSWDLDLNYTPGDYHLKPESPCINAGDPGYVAEPTSVEIPPGYYWPGEVDPDDYVAKSSDRDLDGGPRLVGDRVDMGAYEYGSRRTIYVDRDASGAEDGSSWADAFRYLQDALRAATGRDRILVAEGVYKPDQGIYQPPCERTATFQLISGVAIRGGYAGFGQPDPNARDIELYETILSGDLRGNDPEFGSSEWQGIFDFTSDPNRAENSYSVVTGSGTDSTAVIDGFTITGGNANGPILGRCPDIDYRLAAGAGMYNARGSPTVLNCTFRRNTTRSPYGCSGSGCPAEADAQALAAASGFYCSCASFSTYLPATCGAGMFNCSGSPTLHNCRFEENISYGADAFSAGGGMFNLDSYPVLVNCTFTRNMVTGFDSEYYGGAVYDHSSTSTFTNCSFINNDSHQGGALYSGEKSAATISNCLFVGNYAYHGGGAIHSCGIRLDVAGSTLAGNKAYWGHTIGCDHWQNTSLKAVNCILWNGENEVSSDFSDVEITFSDIQGGWEGQGNINVDPCFAQPGHWDDNGTPDTDHDDFWVDGDYHLKSQAGRWHVSEGRWTIDEVTSPCIDAGDPLGPIGLEPFPNGGIVNMGAYGGTAEASKSYFNKPPCELIVAGDINGDCEIDFRDFFFVALHWLEDYNQ
jgi:predicted outer membrane repeat protein